jgi:hypothetical protein
LKASHAEAQNRKGRKADKGVFSCGSLRLAVFAGGWLFFSTFGVPALEPQTGSGSGDASASRNAVNSAKVSGDRPVSSHASARPSEKAPALKQISIFPASITLVGPSAAQRLLLQGLFEDGHVEDLTSQVRLSSSKPGVASIENGFVRPIADGQARVVAAFQGHQAEAQVEVKDSNAPLVWSFRNQVLPVMTKMGCSSGACARRGWSPRRA